MSAIEGYLNIKKKRGKKKQPTSLLRALIRLRASQTVNRFTVCRNKAGVVAKFARAPYLGPVLFHPMTQKAEIWSPLMCGCCCCSRMLCSLCALRTVSRAPTRLQDMPECADLDVTHTVAYLWTAYRRWCCEGAKDCSNGWLPVSFPSSRQFPVEAVKTLNHLKNERGNKKRPNQKQRGSVWIADMSEEGLCKFIGIALYLCLLSATQNPAISICSHVLTASYCSLSLNPVLLFSKLNCDEHSQEHWFILLPEEKKRGLAERLKCKWL